MLAAVAVACGGATAQTAGPTPTLGSEVADPEDLVPVDTITIEPPDPWAEAEVAAAPLAPLSSAQQIKSAVEEAHGPTTDIAIRMNRFVTFPDLPTPDRAELIELRADARATLDGRWTAVTSEVSFTADGTSADLLDHYASALADQGWIPNSSSERFTGGVLVQRIGYEIPDSPYPFEDFTVEVRFDEISATDGSPRTAVRLRYVSLEEPGDVTIRDRFAGWASDLPLPPGGRITGAGIQTSAVGRNSLHYSLKLSYEGLVPATIAQQLRQALPAEGFSIDYQPPSGDLTDDWVYLNSSFFDDSRVTTHETIRPLAPGTTVNIQARVEFTPAD